MSTEKPGRLLSDPELERIAKHFKVPGEPMRLRILQAVCEGPRTGGEIVSAVGASQANVSKHLSLLAGAGILARKKEGLCVPYRLSDPLTLKMRQLVHSQVAR